MNATTKNERVEVTASAGRLAVFIQIGDVVVAVGCAAPKDMADLNEAQARTAALRLASRALEVAQQEIGQEQG